MQFLYFLGASTGTPRHALTPAHVSGDAIRGFLGELHARGNSRASAARRISAIRSFARYLRREGVRDDDPTALVGSPRREQRVPQVLTVDEVTALIETPDVSTPLGRRDRAILEVFYASGLRLSELVSLDVEDVNLSTRMVRVMGKGRKERLVPCHQRAADAVLAWLKDRVALVALAEDDTTRAGGRRRAARGSAVCELSRHAAHAPQRASPGDALRGLVHDALRHQPARAAALVRHPPARARRRPACDPGTPRARRADHHPALHAGQRPAPARRLPRRPPQGAG